MSKIKTPIPNDTGNIFKFFYETAYFYPKIDTKKAIDMLNKKAVGTYLFRNSTDGIGITCSFVDLDKTVQHCEIKLKSFISFPTPEAVINQLVRIKKVPFLPYNPFSLNPQFICKVLTKYLTELIQNSKEKENLIKKFKDEHNILQVVWNTQNLSKYGITLNPIDDTNVSLLMCNKLNKTETIKYTVSWKEIDHFLAVSMHEDKKTIDMILDFFIKNQELQNTPKKSTDTQITSKTHQDLKDLFNSKFKI